MAVVAVVPAAAAHREDGKEVMKMKLTERYFPKQSRQAICTAVERAESTTSGEIVPALAERSHWWLFERLLYAFAFAFVAALIGWYVSAAHRWGATGTTGSAIIGFVIGLLAGYFIWYWAVLNRPSRQHKFVERMARKYFATLPPTRDHTTLLIYLSLSEQVVFILPDVSIDRRIKLSYWMQPVQVIARAMKQGKHAQGMCEAIGMIGQELAKHFPRQADDINELPDGPEIVK